VLSTWRSVVAPGTFALLVALGGEIAPLLAYGALFLTLFVGGFGIALLASVPVNVVKRRPFVPALVGMAVCVGAYVAATRVVLGVPLWVKARGAAGDHGRRGLESGARPLACQGVAFTKCDYDFDARAWYAWD
jgi:hypothetical protein